MISHWLLDEYSGPNGKWSVYWIIKRTSLCGKSTAYFQILLWLPCSAGSCYGTGAEPAGWPQIMWGNRSMPKRTLRQSHHCREGTAHLVAVSWAHKSSHSYWRLFGKKKNKNAQSCRSPYSKRRAHNVMRMQVVCSYKIIIRHPVNAIAYSYSWLSECLTAVLTKLYFCSSLTET